MFRIIETDELINRLGWYFHKELHIHHTWRPDHEIFSRNPDGIYWQNAMKRFHVETNGWSDIAQHVTLLPDGRFVTGRDFQRNPASIAGYNSNAFMVEMIGDFDAGRDKFEGPQKASMIALARWFDSQGRYIRFHNENSAKTCPGTGIDKDEFMKEVRPEYKPEFTRILREGSKGSDVLLLQRRLKQLYYYYGALDGIFGPKTKAAVVRFQRDHGLVPDGIYGPLTNADLSRMF